MLLLFLWIFGARFGLDGTGTTAAAAKRLSRNYVGIERDETYARLSRARLKAIEPIEGAVLETERSKKSLPRVPFGALLENGWLKNGWVLEILTQEPALVTLAGLLGQRVENQLHQPGVSLHPEPLWMINHQ